MRLKLLKRTKAAEEAAAEAAAAPAEEAPVEEVAAEEAPAEEAAAEEAPAEEAAAEEAPAEEAAADEEKKEPDRAWSYDATDRSGSPRRDCRGQGYQRRSSYQELHRCARGHRGLWSAVRPGRDAALSI